MATVVAFGASLGALVLFLVFKMFEHGRELRVYRIFRTKADRLVVETFSQLRTKGLVLEEQLSVRNVLSIGLYRIAGIVAHIAQKIGRHAEDVSKRIAHNRNGTARKTRSSYLSEVETHKNGLDTEKVRRDSRLFEEE